MKEEITTRPPTTPLHLHGSDNQANHFQAEKIDTVENIVENYDQKYEVHVHLAPSTFAPAFAVIRKPPIPICVHASSTL